MICPFGHLAHAACPGVEVSPAGQDSHEFVAVFSKVPAAQVVHCVLSELETCPLGQEVQIVCPAADISSLAQASHELAPVL